MSDEELLDRIAVDPRVMAGKPVIRGTRLTVEHILNLLAHGQSMAEVQDEYPGVTREDLLACLLFATRSLESTSFVPLVRDAVQMRFLVDESTGPKVSAWLVSHGHDVFCVYTEARGMGDDEVIRKAHEEGWILVTNDKDFGERVFRLHCPHQGVVLLRLEDERSVMKIEILRRLLAQHVERLSGRFVVATERRVRIIES